MAAEALAVEMGQIELYTEAAPARQARVDRSGRGLCAGCRAKEARYGFQPEGAVPSDGLGSERPRTLCFECFRMELDRRHRAAAQLARGWNAEQVQLPLTETLKQLDLRRRRAQIAARHALGA